MAENSVASGLVFPHPEIMQGFKPGFEVIKLEYSLKLKIKDNNWLLADTRPQVANNCAFF